MGRWLGFALLVTLGAATTSTAEPRRWLWALGENRGLSDDPPLKYAIDDAQHVASTLAELSHVEAGRAQVVAGADAPGARASLAALEQRLHAAQAQSDTLFMYVSSHADDGALHLAGTRLPVAELLAFVDRAPVAVVVLVVDSCRSGALTRRKGLTPTGAPRRVEVDRGTVAGRVVITSSGADEYSQESDAVRGSYFTHHLLGGLRGPADASGDGRVTLEEAYLWAYARTVESTFATEGGVQRPQASIELEGEGALVLSEPSVASGQLLFDDESPGEWLVSARQAGGAVALVHKGPGKVSVGLMPGAYQVRLRTDEGYRERMVQVDGLTATVLRADDMRSGTLVRVAQKGAREPTLSVGLGGTLASSFINGVPLSGGGELVLSSLKAAAGPFRQLRLAAAYRYGPASYFAQSEIELRISWQFRWSLGRFSVAVGPMVGAVCVVQARLPDGSSRVGLEPVAGGELDLRLRVLGPLSVGVGGSVAAMAVKKDAGVVGAFRGQGFVGALVDW